MIHVISLGAGVQSTTMALMAKHGELFPMPDCAIFADTGSEPSGVYAHLDALIPLLPFPVHLVRAWDSVYGKPSILGPIGDQLIASSRGEGKAGSHSRPPFFTRNPDGSGGMIRRQCTGDYKIDPIQKKVRELLGLKRGQRWPKEPRVSQWVGISLDEATRMKDSQFPAIVSRWPLIEKRMTRAACVGWLADHGYPEPPKSACVFCPYHSDAEWRRLKDSDPTGWAEAVKVDEAVRSGLTPKSLSGALYVHRSRVPLAEVDLSTAEERGQANLFENECAGVCGV